MILASGSYIFYLRGWIPSGGSDAQIHAFLVGQEACTGWVSSDMMGLVLPWSYCSVILLVKCIKELLCIFTVPDSFDIYLIIEYLCQLE